MVATKRNTTSRVRSAREAEQMISSLFAELRELSRPLAGREPRCFTLKEAATESGVPVARVRELAWRRLVLTVDIAGERMVPRSELRLAGVEAMKAPVRKHRLSFLNFTIAQAAARLGMKPRKLRRLVTHGPVDGIQIGGRLYVNQNTIEKLISEGVPCR